MEISVLNEQYQLEYVADMYESLLWNERYNKAGDFELLIPLNDRYVHEFQLGRYLEIPNSDMTMIIEKLVIETNSEDGNSITVTGRSFESVLNRRIIWGLKVLSGNFQNAIKTLLNECVISPTIADRKIPNIVFIESMDERVTELTIDCQYTGDNLYEVLCNLCAERNVGWKLRRNLNDEFEFQLYFGKDRSYTQLQNPYVTFSPEFDNMLSSSYTQDTESNKNVTLIGGEGEGIERKYATTGTASGLNRRELFTDARDISSEVHVEGQEEPIILTEDEYNKQLQERGKQKLEETLTKPEFTTEIASDISYHLRTDYQMGDIVQVSNGFGHDSRARIMEIIISDDSSGLSVHPTFELIDE